MFAKNNRRMRNENEIQITLDEEQSRLELQRMPERKTQRECSAR